MMPVGTPPPNELRHESASDVPFTSPVRFSGADGSAGVLTNTRISFDASLRLAPEMARTRKYSAPFGASKVKIGIAAAGAHRADRTARHRARLDLVIGRHKTDRRAGPPQRQPVARKRGRVEPARRLRGRGERHRDGHVDAVAVADGIDGAIREVVSPREARRRRVIQAAIGAERQRAVRDIAHAAPPSWYRRPSRCRSTAGPARRRAASGRTSSCIGHPPRAERRRSQSLRSACSSIRALVTTTSNAPTSCGGVVARIVVSLST